MSSRRARCFTVGSIPPRCWRTPSPRCIRLEPPPDVIVITGDLVDKGDPAEYDHLRSLLAPLAMPYFVIPGNHDAREELRAAFIRDGYLPRGGFLQYAIENIRCGWWRSIRSSPARAAANYATSGSVGWIGRWAPNPMADRGHDASSAVCDRHRAYGPRRAARQRRLRRDHRPPRANRAHPMRASASRDRARLPAGTVAGTAPSTGIRSSDTAPAAPLRFTFEPPVTNCNGGERSRRATPPAVFGTGPDLTVVALRPAGRSCRASTASAASRRRAVDQHNTAGVAAISPARVPGQQKKNLGTAPRRSPRLAAPHRARRRAAPAARGVTQGALLGLVLVEHRLGRGLALGAELGAVVAAPLVGRRARSVRAC